MQPKPRHLAAEFGAQFQDESVVNAYSARPPYPTEIIDALANLLGPQQRRVLDLGCGTGDLSLPLARHVPELDAVDVSAAMLNVARSRQSALERNVTWIEAPAETFDYRGRPYGLVVAAESLHWMAWEVVLPAVRAALAPGGKLALVTSRTLEGLPWQSELQRLIARDSTNSHYRSYDLVEELCQRGMFRREGGLVSRALAFEQPVAQYVESFHSRNGFSRQRMGATRAAGFDADLTDLVKPHCPDGVVRAMLSATLTWGRPLARNTRARRSGPT